MSGQVFLTDFGLAKEGTGRSGGLSRLTETGETLGTPAYMSPEQARGELTDLTPASDVWALGCVLHELLTGQRAFDGETPAAIIGRVLLARPQGRDAVRRAGPAALPAVVDRCLHRRPRGRYADAGAVHRDSMRLLIGDRTEAARRRTRRRLGWMAGLLAAGTAVVAGVVWLPGAVATPKPPPAPAWAATLEAAHRAGAADPARAADLAAQAIAAGADDAGLRRFHATCLRQAGRWAEANQAFAGLLDRHPGDPQASYGLALTRWLASEGAHQEFGGYTELLRAAQPTLQGPAAAVAAALLAYRERRWDDGEALLPQLEGSWEVLAIRALLRHHRGRGGREAQLAALRDFDAAIANGPPLAWMRLERGHTLTMLGDHERAVAEYDAAIQLDPGHRLAFYNRGVSLAQLGRLDEALADTNRFLEQFPADARAITNRGELFFQMGQLQRAEAEFTRALKLTPTLATALYNRARVYRRTRRAKLAIADIDRYLACGGDRARGLSTRALAHLDAGDITAAERDAEAAVALDDADGRGYAARGLIRLRRRRPADAEADLRVALERRPLDGELRYNLGVALERQKRFEAAIAEYTEVIRTRPNDARAWNNRGGCKRRSGNPEAALPDYRKAMELAPTLPQPHAGMGYALIALGRPREAARALRRFLELAPGSKAAASIRKRIAALERGR